MNAPGPDGDVRAVAYVGCVPGEPAVAGELVRGTGTGVGAGGRRRSTSARVVTLTGVGGVGKTRLALQVAAEVLPGFREGAWLVELAPVRDPDGVVDAFAAVFGVSARAGQSVEESLVEFLRTKQLLLVVDNCEHLLEAVADLVETLERSCAGVVVLATSREGLALDGEQNLTVPSLAAPAVTADLEAIAQSDAVELFVQRAQHADADFALTPENAAAVVRGVPSSRRGAVGDRVGGGAGHHDEPGGARSGSRPALRHPGRRAAAGGATPPDVAGRDRLVLRPVLRTRAAAARPHVGVRGRRHPRRGRGGVRRRSDRRSRRCSGCCRVWWPSRWSSRNATVPTPATACWRRSANTARNASPTTTRPTRCGPATPSTTATSRASSSVS